MVNQDLSNLKDRVKTYLPQYLQSFGLPINKQFKCLSPDHNDDHPSMGLVPSKIYAHCFSCGANLDIFDIAVIKEHKAESGPDWVKNNLFYLAEKFGIDVPTSNYSKEDCKIMDVFRAYSHAAQIIQQSEQHRLVKDKLIQYGWPKDICKKLNIGSITSYESYISKMTDFYKHPLVLLKECDLDNKYIFQPTNLIFTIKDEHGSPIAFSARDLEFEQKKIEYDAAKEKDPECDIKKPSKYYNSSSRSGIYNKSKTLYLFNESKSSPNALLIVEGQADAVTCYSAGITSVAGICSTAFTKDHLDMIIATGIKHIIFLLDSDEAGQKATDKFITLVENCKYSDLTVEAIILPNRHDPDSFIRSFSEFKVGAKELRKLPRIDSFTWQVSKALEFGEERISLCNRLLPIIAAEPNNLLKQKRADKLAELTKLDKLFLRREVLRLSDLNLISTDKEKSDIIQDIVSSINKIKIQFGKLFPADTI